jgi:hypothetical protein
LTATFLLTDVLDANLALVSAPGMSGTTSLSAAGQLGPLGVQVYTVTVRASLVFSGTVNNTAQLRGAGQTWNLNAPAVTVSQYYYRLFLPAILKQ